MLQFFLDPHAFDPELDLYSNVALRMAMPPMHEHTNYADGALCAPNGRPWPPFLVTEKGASLDEFALRSEHESTTIIPALTFVTRRIEA